MNNAPTPCLSWSGISAKKRRYSSTAVGFPIRIDQKPHAQGLSEGYPSWVCARRVRTYVHKRMNCAPSPEDCLPHYIIPALQLLANAASMPAVLPLCACKNPRQFLTYPLCAADYLLTSVHGISAQQVVNESSVAYEFQAYCKVTSREYMENSFRLARSSLAVHLGVTCRHAIFIPSSFSTQLASSHNSVRIKQVYS